MIGHRLWRVACRGVDESRRGAAACLGACGGAFWGLAVLALVAAGGWLYYDYHRDFAEEHFDDPVKQFKYGSTGGDRLAGIPAGIFMALPQLCREYLPGEGWQSLGFVFEPGMDRPAGTSKRHSLGFDRIALELRRLSRRDLSRNRAEPAGRRHRHAGQPPRSRRASRNS